MLYPLRLDIAALTTSPLPIDLSLVKQHCSVTDTRTDDILTLYTKAAIEWAEGYMHRTIFSRSHVWVLKHFPWDTLREEIRLPRGKTQSVESIEYRTNGTTFTLRGPSSGSPAGSDYQEDLRGDHGGSIMPPRTSIWQIADYREISPVTINFTAGWAANEVPADIIHAILFAVEDAFDIRGTADIDPRSLRNNGPNLHARESLLSGWMLSRWH